MNMFERINELLQQRADLQSRLVLLPYDGTPEIKVQNNSQYLYIRKRVDKKLTSTYVGEYSDELYNILLKNNAEAKQIRKELRKIQKELTTLGYKETPLDSRVTQNIDFARAHMKNNIYDQAVLEGVATTFPQTEEIIDNGKIYGVKASDVQKILNLKHAWEFILDKDMLKIKSDYYVLSHIARIVNEGFFNNGGRIRGVPVSIVGCNYIPPIPNQKEVIENITNIINSSKPVIDIAIELCLYCMKTQIFLDGNKRSSIIFANHYLISKGQGFLIIPEKDVREFRLLLVRYYEGEDISKISQFMKDKCWNNL